MEKRLLALNDPLRDKSWGAQIFCGKLDIAKKVYSKCLRS